MRGRQRDWLSRIAITLLLAPALAVLEPPGPAAAACIGASVTVEPAGARRGAVVTIRGRHFSRNCPDVGRHGVCGTWFGISIPHRDIALVLRAGDQTFRLAVVDGFEFDTAVRIPEDAPEGDATIAAHANGFDRASATFTVLEGQPIEEQLPPDPARAPPRGGFVLAAADGGVFAFGRSFHGSAAHMKLAAPVVGAASTVSGDGYWLLGRDGGVFSYGDAPFLGDATASAARCSADPGPATAIASRLGTRDGYWTAHTRGALFAFRAPYGGAPIDERAYGAQSERHPIVAAASHPGDAGYWVVGRDGGVFAYGEARYEGGMSGTVLAAAIVGFATTPSGKGYWLAGADGGVFAFGDATFHGSTAGLPLNAPIIGIASSPTGNGYWLGASDGGVFAFGDADYLGSAAPLPRNAPVVAITA